MRHSIWIAFSTLLVALTLPTASMAQPFELAGTLTCRVTTPDAAFHFGSARPMTCEFRQDRHPRRQIYRGTLKKYGIEWGILARQWHVVRCSRVSGLSMRPLSRRGPVWRYEDRFQFAYARSYCRSVQRSPVSKHSTIR